MIEHDKMHAMRANQEPSVGRKVHFTPAYNGAEPGAVFDATIAKVNDDGTVNLGCLDGDGAAFPLRKVEYAGPGVVAGTEAARGKWAWPQYVPPRPPLREFPISPADGDGADRGGAT